MADISKIKLPQSQEIYNIKDAGARTLIENVPNQTVKGNGTAFGANDAVDIVAGSNVTVTPNTTNKTITITAQDTKPNDATLTLQVAGTTKATFTADDADNATFNVTAADLGLSQALVFKGITTTNLTDGATTSPITLEGGTSLTPTVGTVVITSSSVSSLPNTEFVWANSKWNKLGDAKSYALNSVTVTGTGALGGGGSLAANRTITHNAGNAASKAEGLYKISTDAYSHVNSATAVTKDDITALGIPGSDTNTTYTFAGGTNKFTVTPSGGTAQEVAVTPSIADATTSAHGLMSSTDKTKLDGLKSPTEVTFNLSTSWSTTPEGHSQSLTVSGVTSNTKGIFAIARTASKIQYQAAAKAQLRCTEQSSNTITVMAYGTKPDVSIPCVLTILE